MDRPRENFTWLKRVPKKDLEEHVYALWNAFYTKPWLHQLACFAIGIEQPQFLFNLDMGLGKSSVASSLVRYHKLRSGLKRTLVLVPNLVNIESWADQLNIHAPDLSYERLIGNKEQRFETINQRADIYLLNYAGLAVYMSELVKDEKKGNRRRVVNPESASDFAQMFNGVVFDETHNLGDSQSLIFRLCKRLSKSCEFRYGLTGTLFGRDPALMWPQFNLIDQGYTLGETLALFRAGFFHEVKNHWKISGVDYVFNENQADELHEFIQHRSIRYTDTECMDMPKRIYIPEVLTWGDEQLIYAKKLISGHIGNLNPHIYISMRQIASGWVGYGDEEGKKAKLKFSENPKLDHLLQRIDQSPKDSKLIVWHQYIFTGELIRDALKKAKIGYAEMHGGVKDPGAQYRRFLDRPEVKVLVANYKAGSAGGNFQEVANYEYFFESPPDPITRSQAEKRVHRPGQKKRVYIYDPMMPNWIEKRILESLKEGRDLYEAVCEGKVKFKFAA